MERRSCERKSLRGYASSNILVEPTYHYFLTVYDLSSWFLEEVPERKRGRTETPSPSSVPALQGKPKSTVPAIKDGKVEEKVSVVQPEPSERRNLWRPRMTSLKHLRSLRKTSPKHLRSRRMSSQILPNLHRHQMMHHHLLRLLHLHLSASSVHRGQPCEK